MQDGARTPIFESYPMDMFLSRVSPTTTRFCDSGCLSPLTFLYLLGNSMEQRAVVVPLRLFLPQRCRSRGRPNGIPLLELCSGMEVHTEDLEVLDY